MRNRTHTYTQRESQLNSKEPPSEIQRSHLHPKRAPTRKARFIFTPEESLYQTDKSHIFIQREPLIERQGLYLHPRRATI